MNEPLGGLTTFLEPEWQEPKMDEIMDHRVAFEGEHVIEKRYSRLEAETDYTFYPFVISDVVYLKYEESQTQLKIKMIASSPQMILDSTKNVVIF